MLKTTDELRVELQEYSNVLTKISRMVSHGELVPIKKGYYETDKNADPLAISSVVYGPSYISFQKALGIYNMIPEKVVAITCATCSKNRQKKFSNAFGEFLYRDVPIEVFPYGLNTVVDGEYRYQIATKEKAVLDMLYIVPPVKTIKALKELLFEDLRIEEELFFDLDFEFMEEAARLYKTNNHNLLIKFLRRQKHD